MLKQKIIQHLAPKISNSIDELFVYAKGHEKNKNDYVLFLANATYDEGLTDIRYNPYTIDYRMDVYNDESRQWFFHEYIVLDMEKQYSETSAENQERFLHYVINLELMMYCHYWESTRILKTLKQLSLLVNNEDYNWKIDVPDMGRHDFIRKEIRDVFGHHGLSAADWMTKTYGSQLRNAFAHSDYSLYKGEIWLLNYKEDGWSIRSLTFDEWDEKFAITTLFFDLLFKKIKSEKELLTKSAGTNEFEILHPTRKGELNKVIIQYREDVDSFNFKVK